MASDRRNLEYTPAFSGLLMALPMPKEELITTYTRPEPPVVHEAMLLGRSSRVFNLMHRQRDKKNVITHTLTTTEKNDEYYKYPTTDAQLLPVPMEVKYLDMVRGLKNCPQLLDYFISSPPVEDNGVQKTEIILEAIPLCSTMEALINDSQDFLAADVILKIFNELLIGVNGMMNVHLYPGNLHPKTIVVKTDRHSLYPQVVITNLSVCFDAREGMYESRKLWHKTMGYRETVDPYSQRADYWSGESSLIYSLGVILYYLSERRYPLLVSGFVGLEATREPLRNPNIKDDERFKKLIQHMLGPPNIRPTMAQMMKSLWLYNAKENSYYGYATVPVEPLAVVAAGELRSAGVPSTLHRPYTPANYEMPGRLPNTYPNLAKNMAIMLKKLIQHAGTEEGPNAIINKPISVTQQEIPIHHKLSTNDVSNFMAEKGTLSDPTQWGDVRGGGEYPVLVTLPETHVYTPTTDTKESFRVNENRRQFLKQPTLYDVEEDDMETAIRRSNLFKALPQPTTSEDGRMIYLDSEIKKEQKEKNIFNRWLEVRKKKQLSARERERAALNKLDMGYGRQGSRTIIDDDGSIRGRQREILTGADYQSEPALNRNSVRRGRVLTARDDVLTKTEKDEKIRELRERLASLQQ